MSAQRYAVLAFLLWLHVYNLLYSSSIETAKWTIFILFWLLVCYLLIGKIIPYLIRFFSARKCVFSNAIVVYKMPFLSRLIESRLWLYFCFKSLFNWVLKTSWSSTIFIVLLIFLTASFQVYSKISYYQSDNSVLSQLSPRNDLPWLVACVKNQKLSEQYEKYLLGNVRVYEYNVLNNIKLSDFIDNFHSFSDFYYKLDANLNSLFSRDVKLNLYRTLDAKSLAKNDNASSSVGGGSCAVWRVKLKPIYGVVNRHGFDYQKWAFTKNIIASGSAKAPLFVFDNSPLSSAIHKVKNNLSSFIQNNTHEFSNYSFFKALLLGDRSDLSRQQKGDFQSMGIAHIIAISGLHLGTLYLWVLYFLYGLVYGLVFLLFSGQVFFNKSTNKSRNESARKRVVKVALKLVEKRESNRENYSAKNRFFMGCCKLSNIKNSLKKIGRIFVVWTVSVLRTFIHSGVVHSQVYRHWLALIIVLAYALLTGWQLPAQRTWIMLLVVTLLMSFSLRQNLLSVLSVALIFILLENPLAAIDVSLHMSVTALIIIMLSLHFRVFLKDKRKDSEHKPIKSRQFHAMPVSVSDLKATDKSVVQGWHTLGRCLVGLKANFLGYLRLQWWFFFLMLPLTTFWLSEVSILSYLYNIITIATVLLLIFPLGLLALLFYLLGWQDLAVFLLQGAELVTHYWLQCLYYVQSLEAYAPVLTNTGFALSLPWFWLVLIVLLILSLSYYRQKWLLLSFAVFFTVAIDWLYLDVFSMNVKPSALVNSSNSGLINSTGGEFRVNVMDVGQGLAVVVSTKKHRLIYDVGAAYSSGFSYFRSVIEPNGKRESWFPVDALVLSHNDNDHAGGFGDFLKHVLHSKSSADIKLFVPSAHVSQYEKNVAKQPFLQVSACDSNDPSKRKWQWDGVSFAFLYLRTEGVDSNAKVKENNRSCILRISSVHGSVLIPGDIEWQIELSLVKALSVIKAADKLESDILLAPHHGSATSSSDGFIKAVNPHSVIYSTARANRYNHPHRDVSQRYENAGIASFNTACLGQLTIDFNAQGQVITSWKNKRNRIWHKKC